MVSGPVIPLAPKTALTFAMALHELVTNAIKYGALSNSVGRIDIEWRTGGEADAQRLLMQWRERNGPPIEAPTRRGFGSRMIEAALA